MATWHGSPYALVVSMCEACIKQDGVKVMGTHVLMSELFQQWNIYLQMFSQYLAHLKNDKDGQIKCFFLQRVA